jgi:hypothetical protein
MKPTSISFHFGFGDETLIDDNFYDLADSKGVLMSIYAKKNNLFYDLTIMNIDRLNGELKQGGIGCDSNLLVVPKIDRANIERVRKMLETSQYLKNLKGTRVIPK